MSHIYFVRHGESEANAGGVSRPDKQLALSHKGKEQAQSVIPQLPKPQKVFVSEMRRTQQTAKPFCEHWQIKPEICSLLNEFSYLDFQLIEGLKAEQRKAHSEAYWQKWDIDYRTSKQVDSFRQFSQRVFDFRQKMTTFEPNTVCFGHGIWIAMLLWQQAGNDPFDMKGFRLWQLNLPMPNCHIEKI